MNFFDSHVHLCDAQMLPDLEGIIARAFAADVLSMLNICTDEAELEIGLALSQSHPAIRNAAAVHPHKAAEGEGEEAFALFSEMAAQKRIVAIGETGLDYHYFLSPEAKERQKRFLKRHLHLAAENRLPVIFHCREAFEDLFAIADAEYPKGAPAILHCFTGSAEEAAAVLERGWHLSFSGIVTFKKSEELRTIAKGTSLSKLLIETDAPYLAPQSQRGKRNEPSFLPEVASCIATAKGIPLEEVARFTKENAARLFPLR